MFKRWSEPGGYREVLSIGLPLVISMASNTVMQFTDRVFLGGYSDDAIAAALPAGIASFLFACFFVGVSMYVNVFVAQYTGAGRGERVGASIWQGVRFSLLASVLMASLYFLADPLFSSSGHPPEVQVLEIVYFRILVLGSAPNLIAVVLSCFYSGRGITRPVMLVNLAGAILNIPLDYALIYGAWIFPEMGIKGAGLATVASWFLNFLLMAALVFSRRNEKLFKMRSARAYDKDLFKRLMRYGLPNGVQFFLEILAFTFLVFTLGRLGKHELVSSNIVLSIDSIAFLPMVGFSIAVSTMVGQAIGRGEPELGARATNSALHLTLMYMAALMMVFIFAPHWMLDLFRPQGTSPQEFAPTMHTGIVLLRFVAVYCLFDGVAIVYSGAIKGAGDSVFVMKAMAIFSIGVMVVPLTIAVEVLGGGLYTVWTLATFYICCLGTTFMWRFRQGKWKTMSVIRTTPTPKHQPPSARRRV